MSNYRNQLNKHWMSQWHLLLLDITIPFTRTKNYHHQWINFEIKCEWKTCAIFQRLSLHQ